MSFLFGKPKSPEVQPLPSAPTLGEAQDKAAAEEKKRKRTKTILTDEDLLGAAPVNTKSLLGE